MKSVYCLTTDNLLEIQRTLGIKENLKIASEILNLLYRYPNKDFSFKSHIPPKLVTYITDNYSFELPKIWNKQIATDGTLKFLVGRNLKESVECVLLPFRKSFTLCVSSQVGCAMNCSFCHTATQGLQGNLKAQDIIAQYMIAKKELQDSRPITNMVFMGQGEPLHNFNEVKQAIGILTDPNGISMGRQKITVSTSGFLPGIKRFNELGGVNFALSLHSIDPVIRSQLIPINKKYSLDEVENEIKNIKLRPKQFIEYEYLLIDKLNDSPTDAQKLAKFLEGKNAILNIIPYNEFEGSPYKKPTMESQNNFVQVMVSNKIRTMLRGTKGDNIMAACGQLKS